MQPIHFPKPTHQQRKAFLLTSTQTFTPPTIPDDAFIIDNIATASTIDDYIYWTEMYEEYIGIPLL